MIFIKQSVKPENAQLMIGLVVSRDLSRDIIGWYIKMADIVRIPQKGNASTFTLFAIHYCIR